MTFQHYPSQNRRYCSAKCSNRAKERPDRKAVTRCPACGVEFEFALSWPRKYCSKTCSGRGVIGNIKHFRPSSYDAICEQCGVSFRAAPTQTRGRFCSQRCVGQWKSANVCGVASPNYGKKFGRPSNAGPIVTAQCVVCSKEFVTKRSHVARRKTCSRECVAIHYEQTGKTAGANNGNWRGGYLPYYGPSWGKNKRAARARDKACADCGKTPKQLKRALDVHHKVPFREFGVDRHLEANDLSNLISLCNVCHLKRDWEYEKARRGSISA